VTPSRRPVAAAKWPLLLVGSALIVVGTVAGLALVRIVIGHYTTATAARVIEVAGGLALFLVLAIGWAVMRERRDRRTRGLSGHFPRNLRHH
jgi:hypothetical protein